MLLSKVTYCAFRLYIYCQYVCSLGIEPTTFALLTECSTTEPQEHEYIYIVVCVWVCVCCGVCVCGVCVCVVCVCVCVCGVCVQNMTA